MAFSAFAAGGTSLAPLFAACSCQLPRWMARKTGKRTRRGVIGGENMPRLTRSRPSAPHHVPWTMEDQFLSRNPHCARLPDTAKQESPNREPP